jgi:hypothetical protein
MLLRDKRLERQLCPHARGSLANIGRLMADTDYPYTEFAKFSERRTASAYRYR